MALLLAEGLRCRRQPALWIALASLATALLTAAVASGFAAAEQRARQVQAHEAWLQRLEARRLAAADQASQPGSRKAAAAAFEVGRHLGPRISLPGAGGLALAVHGAERLDGGLAIGIESRHLDARLTEPVGNPMLAAAARLDLAVLIALLLPLALVALCHGLVHEDRELGRWRLVCAQAPRPWAVVATALAWRGAAVFSMAVLASVVAFALDTGATAGALGAWLVALAGFALTWTLVVAVATALPLSSSGATLLLVGAWALTSFVVPALLGAWAQRTVPMPSRLEAVVESREAHQLAETRNDELLARWYGDHGDPSGLAGRQQDWPVSFVPRYLWIDARLRPTMSAFDATRARQSALLDRWSAVSPALALVMSAEALAGTDAERHARYATEVDLREDQWRGRLVPAVMHHRPLHGADFDALSGIGRPAAEATPTESRPQRSWMPALLLAAVCLLLRWRVGRV